MNHLVILLAPCTVHVNLHSVHRTSFHGSSIFGANYIASICSDAYFLIFRLCRLSLCTVLLLNVMHGKLEK